jgi:hypothetical protein
VIFPRVVRRVIDGETYYPVERDGRYLDLGALETLRVTPGNLATIGARFYDLVLFDESPLENGWRFDVAGIPDRFSTGLPLVFAEPSLLIGIVTDIRTAAPGTIADVVGWCLLGTARLFDSELADVAVRAIADGLMTGICTVVDCEPEPPNRVTARFEYARLINAGECHMPGARVLRAWP